MYAIRVSSGRSFSARSDETILDAALRQGVTLGYSCRTGRCSSCKGRVRKGETITTHDELGLSADEKTAGTPLDLGLSPATPARTFATASDW